MKVNTKSIGYIVIIILIVVIVVLYVRYINLRDTSLVYKQEIAQLELQVKEINESKEVLLELVSDLQDSLKAQKIKIEYVYIQLDDAEDYVANIPPNKSYEELNIVYPEKDTLKQIFPFSAPQVQDIHLAVIERVIYADLSTQYQKALKTSDNIISSQNEAVMKSDSIIAFDKRQRDILERQLAAKERKVKGLNTTTTILGGAAGVELLLILIILL